MNIIVEDWGIIDYTLAYQRQKSLVQEIIAGGTGHLIFCEHPPVLTLGRTFTEGSLLYTKEEIEQRGVTVQTVDRGGDVTLHAPGQLVVYVILDLNLFKRDLKGYLEKLEQVAVDLLKEFGILAVSVPGKRGVFVKADKIISIGVGVRKWVSYHGVGINVNTDLSLFSLIKPCGLDVHMTSMAKLLGRPKDMDEVKKKWAEIFSKTFKGEMTS
ncbi:MAG: lipoyl(octanoyl) transferase LipB [Candidatus Omnitrophica bacterium]|nr:lipoyl(octanoyl) transferase LipB [Candidatus Omnitrophota bacterium]